MNTAKLTDQGDLSENPEASDSAPPRPEVMWDSGFAQVVEYKALMY
jgi:hypothetical protein